MVTSIPRTLIVTANIPANQPASSVNKVTITRDVLEGPLNSVQLPLDRRWVIKDVYISSSGDVGVDGVFIFYKNFDKVVARSQKASTLLVSNPSRPKVSIPAYEPGDVMYILFINLVAGGTAAATTTIYIDVEEIILK